MDLQPPDVEVSDGKAVLPKESASEREGVGGWISRIAKSNKAEGNGSGSGKYQRVGQEDEDQ